VIDWHNLGFTLLRLRLGRTHPAVRLARWYERRDARRVDANLCVSRGLAAFLESRFGVQQARVLYDRPASSFVPMERTERERLRQALFTRLGVHGGAAGFIVCPTSWTEDEDFGLIIDAVPRLEERIRGWEAAAPGRRFTDLVILVTGDGARRAEFERRFAGLAARRIHLRARWLEPEDYPRVVGSADLGLCLHRSSSGLDIPMKVADLFGAGVPVCALDYGACLAERVRHADNGLLFSTAVQLADVLFDLVYDDGGWWHRAVGYVAVSMLGVAAIALFLSTVTDSALGAAMGALAVLVTSQVLVTLDAAAAIRPYLPTRYWLAWVDFFREPVLWRDIERGAGIQLVYLVVLLGAAWANFLTKDVAN